MLPLWWDPRLAVVAVAVDDDVVLAAGDELTGREWGSHRAVAADHAGVEGNDGWRRWRKDSEEVAAFDIVRFAASSCYNLAGSGGAQMVETHEFVKALCRWLIVMQETSGLVDQELGLVLRNMKGGSCSIEAADNRDAVADDVEADSAMVQMKMAVGVRLVGIARHAVGYSAVIDAAAEHRHHSFGTVHCSE